MSKQVILYSKTFPSYTKCTEYIRNLLKEIGITNSVKTVSMAHYENLLSLLKRHPEATEKLENLEDLQIYSCPINKTPSCINILRIDNTIMDISWRVCVNGKGYTPSQQFKKALRECISYQIRNFRTQADLSHCTLCNEEDPVNIHIDHILHFKTICENFMAINKIEIPIDYDQKSITYQTIFKKKDEWIASLFQKYHLDNATLRVTCAKCNIERGTNI
jgi:hypothetical protein